jgi:hypothetical protein
MKYYLHDANAFSDEKITELYLNFGYEGLGLFYTFLEKISAQEKPIKTTVLKSQLNVGKKLDKCWSFMEEIGLISSNNGESFNEQLLNFSGKYQIKKEKNKEKVKQWREKQAIKDNVTSYEPVSNPPKVNKSKVKESKVNVRDLVTLTLSEQDKLISDHGEQATNWMLDKLNAYKLSKGKTYKSDYGAILTWVVKSYEEHKKTLSKEETNPLINAINQMYGNQ